MGKKRRMGEEARAWWRRQITAQEASGQGVRDYCAARGLAPSVFYSWRKRLRREKGEGRTASRVGFARVVLARAGRGTASGARPLEIETPGGWLIRVGPGCDEASLRRAVAALGGGPCC
jgi:transposase-like protein